MKYMLLMNYAPEEYDGITATQEELDEILSFMDGLNDRLRARGEMLGGEGLAPPGQARRVRYVDDGVVVTPRAAEGTPT